jgi:hypothetical protein
MQQGTLSRVRGYRGWEVSPTTPTKVLIVTPQAHAEKQSHLVWALTGHVQRQRREMQKQQHWLRQIQGR